MKKFIISSDTLKSVLDKLSQAVSQNHILPVLTNVLCKVTTDEVELITSDTELTISIKSAAETSGDFELLLPFFFLQKIAGLAGSCPIVVEHPSTRKAKISDATDSYELNSLDKLEEFAKLPSVPKANTLQLNAEFVKLLGKAMHTTGSDENRPVLTRACLDITANGIYLVSTDTNCIFKHKVPGESPLVDQLHFSKKMAKALKGLSELEVSWSAKIIAIKSNNTTVWAKRFEDRFPNYNVAFRKENPNLEVERENLLRALNKACLSSSAVKSTEFKLKESAEAVHMITDDPDYQRKIRANVEGKYTGVADGFLVNAKKMLTMVEQIEVDKVWLHVESSSKAVLISSDEDKDYLGLIMPLQPNS